MDLVQLLIDVVQVIMRLVGAHDEILMYHTDKLGWLADTPLLDLLVDQLGPQVLPTSAGIAYGAWNSIECLSGMVPLSPCGAAHAHSQSLTVSLLVYVVPLCDDAEPWALAITSHCPLFARLHLPLLHHASLYIFGLCQRRLNIFVYVEQHI